VADWQNQAVYIIDSESKVAVIRMSYSILTHYGGVAYTNGFEFLNKQGKSILKVGTLYDSD
jgi:hypothetical protein